MVGRRNRLGYSHRVTLTILGPLPWMSSRKASKTAGFNVPFLVPRPLNEQTIAMNFALPAKTRPAPVSVANRCVSAGKPKTPYLPSPPLPQSFCAHCIRLEKNLTDCLWRPSGRQVLLCPTCRDPEAQVRRLGIILALEMSR